MTPTSKVNTLFAEAVFTSHNQRRYGLRNCNAALDMDELADLKEVLKCQQELETQTYPICRMLGISLQAIEEKIQTL
jgi:hypothetical protein